VLRNNLVSVDSETLPRNGGYRAGVEAVDAFLRAEDNTVAYAADPVPDQAFDSGFIQTGGCSPIARNRVLAFKTSFAANAFHFVPPAQGCVYAMYLRLDSNPKVRDNHFFLGWLNNRDIDEECVGCDPEELWGNVFHTHSADSILYLDRTSAELEPTSLDSMSEVEALNRPGMGWGR
jgi:hypothetical protein